MTAMDIESNANIDTLADRAGLEILSPPAIADLDPDDRVAYLARLRAFCLDHDIREHGPYADWLKFADRCAYRDEYTDLQCSRTRYQDHRTCLRHLDLNGIDPMHAVKQQSDRARLRMAEMLEAGVDRLEEIINADPEDVTPNVRLNAISTLFDRAGLPKQTSSSIDARVEVDTTASYSAVITERLDRLASSTISRELEGIEEVMEVEVVEDQEQDRDRDS